MTASVQESTILKAFRREPTERTPVWLMRQAGRYQKEYREIREKVDFLTLCKTPELASEVTVMAVRQLDVDAAIIFADILLPMESFDLGLRFEKGDGPVIERPIASGADVERLPDPDAAADLDYVCQSIRLTCKELGEEVPLIGFAGAPFTVASYAIEGGSSRSFEKTKTFMHSQPDAWRLLMNKLVAFTSDYLKAQIAAGARAVQIFDSWVGCLSPLDFEVYVETWLKTLILTIDGAVPVIYFSTTSAGLLPCISRLGADVIGVDWRVPIDDAWRTIGYDHAIQGNLDPMVLLCERSTILRHVEDILWKADGRPGHVFNLGHGILPGTPVDNVRYLVETVRELSDRR
ncbi:MAG: uroporphyrinogen decarboxylase [Candidatus Obscuribacterales bacterium]